MKNKKGSLWISAGLLLIAAALFLTVWNLYDDFIAQQSADQLVRQLEKPSDAGSIPPEEDHMPEYVLNPDMEMPVRIIDGEECIGILQIPALGLELPVISSWSYAGLKISPCRYRGSAYSDNLIIAGHNYRSHFGRLRSLSEGDMILFTDVDGHIFTYTVAGQEILNPEDADEMESGNWDLTLFTCTLGGSGRITVRCVRKTD